MKKHVGLIAQWLKWRYIYIYMGFESTFVGYIERSFGRRHDEQKLHQCEFCSSSFVYAAQLRKHIRSVHENKDYYCVECDIMFKSMVSCGLYCNGSSCVLSLFLNVPYMYTWGRWYVCYSTAREVLSGFRWDFAII